MLEDLTSIARLPWTTLVVVASGYSAYLVAHAGRREHHQTIEIAFATLVFGLFGGLMYDRAALDFPEPLPTLLAVGYAVAVAILWSGWGRWAVNRSLRFAGLTYSDDLPSSFLALTGMTGVIDTQLSVKLANGAWLFCENLHAFRNAPSGPCVLGKNGDVLMYVTHYQSAGASERTPCTDLDSSWGQEMTFIPKDQIARIDIRRKRAS